MHFIKRYSSQFHIVATIFPNSNNFICFLHRSTWKLFCTFPLALSSAEGNSQSKHDYWNTIGRKAGLGIHFRFFSKNNTKWSKFKLFCKINCQGDISCRYLHLIFFIRLTQKQKSVEASKFLSIFWPGELLFTCPTLHPLLLALRQLKFLGVILEIFQNNTRKHNIT